MWGLLERARRLRQAGVLGLNRRNHQFIQPRNPRRLFPNVDDKLRTKRLAKPAGLRVPKTLGVIRAHHQLGTVGELLAQHDEFVIKPARGSAGHGILVAVGRAGAAWKSGSGKPIDGGRIQRHLEDTLSGLFSLGGRADQAMLEEHILVDERLADFTYAGLPDVRIVVYRGFPVMAMARLPTAVADGKANLHQGAVGVGLSISRGEAVAAVQHDRPVTRHPDTEYFLGDLRVPHWPELWIAARSYDVSGLGYLGVDLVLARDRGPVVLEMNARPGLGIQIANREGMKHRLDLIDSIEDVDLMNAEERADLVQELFPAEGWRASPAIEQVGAG